ncbi:hypothetical protein [Bacillus alkalicellulosilyticus]|uniref:hypothetical protein n=1 Tax=Alkalihalobacterium alkalicellulosilyticum TaxID=1912214 RepID=UPI000995E627|nr:hypothetical protein [Bacillus alkalicellulosilyticus]
MPLNTASESLEKAGRFIEENKKRVRIRSKADMNKIPLGPGVYWIETTMPESDIFSDDVYKRKK